MPWGDCAPSLSPPRLLGEKVALLPPLMLPPLLSSPARGQGSPRCRWCFGYLPIWHSMDRSGEGPGMTWSLTEMVRGEGPLPPLQPPAPPQALPVVDGADVVVGKCHGVPGGETTTGITAATHLPPSPLLAGTRGRPRGPARGYRPSPWCSPCGTSRLYKAGKRQACA